MADFFILTAGRFRFHYLADGDEVLYISCDSILCISCHMDDILFCQPVIVSQVPVKLQKFKVELANMQQTGMLNALSQEQYNRVFRKNVVKKQAQDADAQEAGSSLGQQTEGAAAPAGDRSCGHPQPAARAPQHRWPTTFRRLQGCRRFVEHR